MADKTLVTVKDMKSLLAAAKATGTLEIWAESAIQWMEEADKELTGRTEGHKDRPNVVTGNIPEKED